MQEDEEHADDGHHRKPSFVSCLVGVGKQPKRQYHTSSLWTRGPGPARSENQKKPS